MDWESPEVEITLLDLIHAVQDEARSDREVVATLTHLLDSGVKRKNRRARR